MEKETAAVVKEDVLCELPYNEASHEQQMLYHAFKRIEALEAQVKALEKLDGI